MTRKKAPASAEDDNDGFLKRRGPGLITGASDDDPSGIGTYSQAGAQLGFGVGWTMLLTYPLMVAIQEISGRIGRITGHGIAGNVCRNFGGPAIWSLVVLLFAANAINIAADLGAMGDALKLAVGGSSVLYVIAFALVSVLAQVFLEYKRYVAILKWLTLVLFAYVVALFVVKVPWLEAVKGLLVPTIQWNGTFLTTLVAVLWTTISPYLFVWQSSQEAEQQRPRQEAAEGELRDEATRNAAHPYRHDGRHGLLQHHRDIDHHHHGSYAARDPPLVLAEAQFLWNGKKGDPGLDGKFKIGGWRHFGTFTDERFTSSGVSLANPAAGGVPANLSGDFGVYSVFEQKIYRVGHDDDRGTGIFARASYSPPDRNIVDLYADAGIEFVGLDDQRPKDKFGIAAAYARVSPWVQALDADFQHLNGTAWPARSYEALVTAVYQYEVRAGWTLQPNFQYITHPGGGATNPLGANQPGKVLKDAAVFGLRTVLKF